ncbi:MAG: CoA-binding protein [Lentisphaeria bacterium]|nr:CoA-binding protein [Lentisphaeria bacterium]
MNTEAETVVVLGASPKPERYSNQAVRLLLEKGHRVIPVHPAVDKIESLPVVRNLAEVETTVDTVTIYVSAAISSGLQNELLRLAPQRVLFNPGAENPSLQDALRERGVRVQEACTLVLLKTDQF